MTGASGRVRVRLLPAAAGSGCAAAGWSAVTWWRAARAAGAARWDRPNYAGRSVSLLAGPIGVAAAVAGTAATRDLPDRARLAGLITGVGLVGAFDDLHGSSHARGLGGHLGALRSGRVTTGMVKLVAITALSLLLSPKTGSERRRAADATLIALSANLANLFDLRPGRSLKVVAAVTAPLALGPTPTAGAAAGVLGAAGAVAVPDLRELGMLGDCGANAFGAAAGWLWASRGGRGTYAALLGALALTLLSERVSFSRVIERTPLLNWLDGLGRRH